MLALGLASLQLMLDRGAQQDWFHSMEIWIETGVAVASLWMFLIDLLTGRNTLFDRKMLADRTLLTSLGFLVVLGLVLFPSMARLAPLHHRRLAWPETPPGG